MRSKLRLSGDMVSKSNTIVGLDIGTSQIRVLVGQSDREGKPNIIGVGSSPSRGLRKGVVINIEATVQSIAEAVEQAETMAGIEIHSVYAGISGAHIRGLNSNGVVGIKNKEVSAFDIEKVIDAARAVAIPSDREVLHVLPQEFIVDDQDGIREPMGISGVRLEARVHIVTGAVATAQNVVKCANRCGLTVKDIILAPLSSSIAVLSPEEQDLGVCLIDIGGGTTDLIVYHQGSVRHTSVIPVGGMHLTNDIASGLRTPISAAEDIKCRFGNVQGDSHSSETIEVASTGGRPPRIVSRSALGDIIEPRISEVLSLVRRELERHDSLELLASGLVITGGTANLAGIAELAEGELGIPVRVGKPSGISGLKDLVAGPEYSTGIGLIQFAAQARTISQYSQQGSFSRRIWKRVSNWVGEHL